MASWGDLAGTDQTLNAGSGDFLTLGLAAQMRKPPKREAQVFELALNPGGSIVGDSRQNTSVFSRCSRTGPP